MEDKGIDLLIGQKKKKRKCKEIKSYYNIICNNIMRKKIFFIIFLIIFKVRLSKDKNNNYYNFIEFTNSKKKNVKYSTKLSLHN